MARLRAHGSAPATVRQTHRVFSLLLALAVRDGRIPRNPADKVPLPRVTRGEPRFLSRDEVEWLAGAGGADGDIVQLLAYTGLRFGGGLLAAAGIVAVTVGLPGVPQLRATVTAAGCSS